MCFKYSSSFYGRTRRYRPYSDSVEFISNSCYINRCAKLYKTTKTSNDRNIFLMN